MPASVPIRATTYGLGMFECEAYNTQLSREDAERQIVIHNLAGGASSE